ncbi:penicillin acylase family protein [Maribacter algarum]|uniref:Penicillin acylase family protein n=1 Tax=Maribacter algarum (ex Zhang et al. 2020) TaxID=2578118 RepID=A0A5S3PRF9_9FLAO|nr:penicillin acylase family protein [Maribacter algarum]TMM57336.1 penicillin acylase family protein [Maribacter algarum]
MPLLKFCRLCLLLLLVSACKLSQKENQISIVGLSEPVEILRDQWGVNHIYAKNQKDLFFAQGYAAAKDRLFQFEIWRRQATGTVAEILGPDELKRDIGTRLFQFRGNLEEELNHYHPEGSEIINAYTDGVNAYIEEMLKTPDNLPIEFRILDILPKKWTPDVVISRHQGLKGNVNRELQYGMAVAKIGEAKVKELMWFHPNEPNISLDPKIDASVLSEDILALHKAYASGVVFEEQDIDKDYLDDGSNNWAVTGSKTESGYPLLANDPHRRVALPSLRYMVHLVAPGWNVIGGGEPEIPGISIGHNEYGAWGLTIFRTDGEDLYVYDLNPQNLSEYKYKDEWVSMKEIQDEIQIKGQETVKTTLRYSIHGPVTYIDSVNHKAYAVKCAWLEKGGAPYLASLRMDQSQTWEEFKEACTYSNIPAENMVWADKKGNIGWQAVGITPIRKSHSGLVPVPGDGSYDWEGYLPISERPNSYNPEKGYLATANQNVTSADYKHQKTLNYIWADSYRGKRIDAVLSQEKSFTMKDMEELQSDYLSIPARTIVPMLQNIKIPSEKGEEIKNRLLKWDYILDGNSVEAGIYAMWERIIRQEAENAFIPEEVNGLISLQLEKIISWLEMDGQTFGPSFEKLNKEEFLQNTLASTINALEKKLGGDMAKWKYGQANFKHSTMKNALSAFVNDSLQAKIDLGTFPRGGNSFTPNSTGNNDNQVSGGSFKFIADLSDWDKTLMINSPGQSGNPESKYYGNLHEMWSKNAYFPAYYSKEKIMKVTESRIMLVPEDK